MNRRWRRWSVVWSLVISCGVEARAQSEAPSAPVTEKLERDQDERKRAEGEAEGEKAAVEENRRRREAFDSYGLPYGTRPLRRSKKLERLYEEAEARGMVYVSGGPFFVGCNESVDKECYADEKPGRYMEVGAFSIDRTEVTVSAYGECVAAEACSSAGLRAAAWGTEFCNWGRSDRADHPINCVTWDEAKAYCSWRGKRLPTEAEWEKAARGTHGRKYPWGSGKLSCNLAVTSGCGRGTQAVGGRVESASPYGSLDMIGNVWEWTSDPAGSGRSVRGGSWSAEPWNGRASYRSGLDPARRSPRGGFRCAQ